MKWIIGGSGVLLAVMAAGILVSYNQSQASPFWILDNLLSAFGIDIEGALMDNDANPELYMTATDLIEYNGYVSETHVVATSDGYLLELHRIPGKRYETKRKKPPIFLMHCILCSSGIWVVNGLKDSLGFQLSDEGFDVWMGNLRGNRYSRKHRFKSPDNDADFWNYNLDDHALIDLPTMIDYVLAKTEYKSLAYVGHSLGSFVCVLLLSGKPDYNRKIHVAVLEAPFVYGRHLTNPLRLLKDFFHQIDDIIRIFPTLELLPSTPAIRSAIRILCSPNFAFAWICQLGIMLMIGYNYELLNTERVHIQIQQAAAGSSWIVGTHLSQIVYLDHIQKYDFGYENNLLQYGQSSPPVYNFSRIASPLAMFLGDLDAFTHPKDVEKFVKQLKGNWTKEYVQHDLWSHVDFVFAKNLKFYLNDRVVEVIKKSELALVPNA